MITRVSVKNFRSCKNTELSISSPICALVGRNGVGKSNVLRAVDWMAKAASAAERPKLDDINGVGSVEITATVSIDSVDFQYQIQQSYPNDDGEYSITERLLRNGEEQFSRKDQLLEIAEPKSNLSLKQSAPALYAIESLLPDSTHDRIKEMRALRRFFAAVSYYSAHEVTDSELDIVFHKRFVSWKDKYEQTGDVKGPLLFKLLLSERTSQQRFDEYREIVGASGLGLVEFGRATEFDLPLKPESPSDTTKFYSYAFKPLRGMAGKGGVFPFSDLSDGTKRILIMLASLLFDKRSIMLVEEPEGSIHQGLLHKLLSVMRSYADSTNVLLSTHSSGVLDVLKPEEVRMVQPGDEGGTVVRKLSDTELAAVQTFLKEEGSISSFLESIGE